MKIIKKFLSISLTFVVIMLALFSYMPNMSTAKPNTIPQIAFASVPVTEYTVGDRVKFNIYAPNYGGRVECRVILWNDSKKSFCDLWYPRNGYPTHYYSSWQPYGSNIFTLSLPILQICSIDLFFHLSFLACRKVEKTYHSMGKVAEYWLFNKGFVE